MNPDNLLPLFNLNLYFLLHVILILMIGDSFLNYKTCRNILLILYYRIIDFPT